MYVIDETDTMFDRGFGPNFHKFLDPLTKRTPNGGLGLQILLVTATLTQVC